MLQRVQIKHIHRGDVVPVTVIIPTLADASRHQSLIRAIESAKAASRERVSVIVVVNGNRWNANTVTAVETQEGVKVVRLKTPSAPGAVAYGRPLVETEFFAFLDDDDEFLPQALDLRLNVLRADPNSDVVVSNGLRRIDGCDSTILSNLLNVESDPLRALFVENWLPSCGALFRTKTIEPRYFDDYHEYAEWTWLAYRLAMDNKRVRVLNALTFIVNETVGSLSKTATYRASYLSLYERMLGCKPPPDVREEVEKRITTTLHDISCDSLDRGEAYEALRYHLRSLVSPSGLKYLSYTRHVALGFFRPRKVGK